MPDPFSRDANTNSPVSHDADDNKKWCTHSCVLCRDFGLRKEPYDEARNHYLVE